MVVSTHVDDLKGGGEKRVVAVLLRCLEKAFGKLNVEKKSFEHCGVLHVQHDDFSVTMSQQHYVQQLKPLPTEGVDETKPAVMLSEQMRGMCMSLLGGLSWLTQTRPDICVYVCAMRRVAAKPQVEHLIRMNRVLKWCKRKQCHLHFAVLSRPFRVVTVSDSAFKKEEDTGHAMRGAMILLSSDKEPGPGGKSHIVEFYSRK